jgi:nicotinamidase-related amidase
VIAHASREVTDGGTSRARTQALAGSPATHIIDELNPHPVDVIIDKQWSSAFYGSKLECILKALGTEIVLMGGISMRQNVKGTARDAKNRTMQCIVISDCCTAGELDIHEMTIKHVLPLLVHVRSTDERIAALRKS